MTKKKKYKIVMSKTFRYVSAIYNRLVFLIFHVLKHKEGRNLRAVKEVMLTEYYDWG